MACRISQAKFYDMVAQEAQGLGLREWEIEQTDPVEHFDMAEVDGFTATLNRKAIQSLVDEPEQARPIIRNLLRWAKEHGAK